MPKVSVLVPAFRPDYLDTTIASVLSQSMTDYELIVADDSGGRDIESVVSKWSDPRIRYERNPRTQEPGANRDFLIGLASGKYLKFVFDDDFLLPRSLEFLCAAADQGSAALVFHARHRVDSAGRIMESTSCVPTGKVMAVPADLIFTEMVSKIQNFIGEPSNVLVDAERLRSIPNPFGLGDMRMRFLTDVALYLNLASRALPIVGVGFFGSAFRIHEQQTSSTSGTARAAGLFEWDLFNRWAADRGHLAHDAALAGITLLHHAYRREASALPELEPFLDHVPGADAGGRYLTPAFLDTLERGWAAVDQRRVRDRRAA